ncbi:beta-ketoacyl synthase chain length factor [Simiduia agarivorans]|uniref:Beta-ketoacyl synthase-like N-terminal domain-containing protein n=1 Tax=Simiduia agarivorans (strain DSM 21679 / JCM 13881 / BCRC 17597 / SA1) TaxID=1117647 RepID=K4KXD4_SIMAS|nr:beta-ketoacyl synthase chain length factor [Simiduia agarivorans]AFU98597.1 hypothetical protein M5M_07010 [Simiduia agarivorans SA1 = DSM 21679]
MNSVARVAVRRWNAWLPGIQGQAACAQWAAGERAPAESDQPDVAAVPAMLRRRLGPLGKPVAAVAWDMLEPGDHQSLVFASRHGDQAKTLQLLSEIGAGSPLSPAAFSMSVHNATAGLLSIAKKATGPHTALSANSRLLSAAVIEAYGQLMSGARAVVCVLYDLPLPADYSYHDNQSCAYAVALELTLEEGRPLTLAACPSADLYMQEPEVIAWLRWWSAGAERALALKDGAGGWLWQS